MRLTKLTSISAFAPCLNEEKNLEPLIHSLNTILPQVATKYEIIIINDGSTDNTKTLLKNLSKKYQHLRYIHHPKNLGYGATLQTGFKAAKNDWIFFTDGDRQFDVTELTQFVPWTKSFNAILGFRKKRAEGNLRAFNAYLFKLFIDILFRVNVKDIDCAFKLIKSEAIKSLSLKSTGAMISAELLYRLKKRGEKFKQLSVTHLPREFGTPTGNNPKVIIKAGYEALKLYIDIKFRHK